MGGWATIVPMRLGARRVRPWHAAVVLFAAMLVVVTAGSGTPRTLAQPARTPWRLKLFDDFRHGLSRSRWGKYSGGSIGDPGGLFRPSHVVVRNGTLDLQTYRDPRFGGRWVSGGMSSAPAIRQTYGKYEVRFRMDSGYGVGGDLLLWPSRGQWPPEVDFAENDGVEQRRNSMSAFVHYGADNKQVQRTVRADFSHWQTLGVEWTPGLLAFTIDGRTWATVRGAVVPAERMEMDIQAVAGTCGVAVAPCPDATTPARVHLQVAWVRIYSYRPVAQQQ